MTNAEAGKTEQKRTGIGGARPCAPVRHIHTLDNLITPMRTSLLFNLLAALLLFAGCSDDSPTDGDTTPDDFAFSTTIDGSLWEADSAVYRTPVLPGFVKEIVAWQGQENLGERITISLNKTAPGTYPLTGMSNPDIILQYTTDLDAGPAFNADNAPAAEGSVTITEVNDSFIAGSFTFKATGFFSGQSFEAAEGTFKVEAR